MVNLQQLKPVAEFQSFAIALTWLLHTQCLSPASLIALNQILCLDDLTQSMMAHADPPSLPSTKKVELLQNIMEKPSLVILSIEFH